MHLLSHSLKRQKVHKPANKRVQHKVLPSNVGSTSSRLTLLQQASSNTVEVNVNEGNVEEQLEEVLLDNYASSSDPESVSISGSSDTESELEDLISIEENAEEKLEDDMFKPLYEGASISISGAYCAIMELKRACRLPFTTIAKLLDLLQLVCPANNHLPTSVHKFKKFFGQYSSECTAHYHCHVCHTEYLPGQKECTNCANAKQDTLIVINPKKAITRVLNSKFYKLNV